MAQASGVCSGTSGSCSDASSLAAGVTAAGLVCVSGTRPMNQRWASTPATRPSIKNTTMAMVMRLRYWARSRFIRAFMAAVCLGEYVSFISVSPPEGETLLILIIVTPPNHRQPKIVARPLQYYDDIMTAEGSPGGVFTSVEG